MDVLIIGGTQFVGYHITETLLANGHNVTLFNRGRTNPGAFADVEEIHGDRDRDLKLLDGRKWDAVIDTCGYRPQQVIKAARQLKDSTQFYQFVSTVSVYAEFGGDEDSELIEVDASASLTNETYGGLKVHCENAALQYFGADRVMITRPGLIVGPRDITNRFGYWPLRVQDGGTVLAPAPETTPVQFIDGRDLADFSVHLLEAQTMGIFNVVGPASQLSFKDFLDTAATVINPDATFTWVSPEFLEEHGVMQWVNLPLWVTGEAVAMQQTTNARAIDVGLTFRTLEDTLRDTLAWLQQDGDAIPDKYKAATLTREREQAILNAWSEHSN